QLATTVVAHGPQTTVTLEEQAVDASCGNCRDIAGHNLLRAVGVVGCAVAQPAIIVEAHGPQATVALEEQAVVVSCGNRGDVAGHNLLGEIGAYVASAVAQLAIRVCTHRPQTAAALEKQAVAESCGNHRDPTGHNLLGAIDSIVRGRAVSAVAQLAIPVPAHGPQTAVAFEKQAVPFSCGSRGHGLRSAGDGLHKHHRTQQRDLNQI